MDCRVRFVKIEDKRQTEIGARVTQAVSVDRACVTLDREYDEGEGG